MQIYIWGAGGFGNEVYWYLRDHWMADHPNEQPSKELAVFADDDPLADQQPLPAPFVGRPDSQSYGPDDQVVIGLGDPDARAELAFRADALGLQLRTVVHPTAWVAPSARLGRGVIITPFVFVAADSRIGSNVMLNTYASVGHDGVVGAHSVMSPYAVINGNATLGEQTFMGTHATVTPGVSVGDHCIVGAASLIRKDLPAKSVALGNPPTIRAR